MELGDAGTADVLVSLAFGPFRLHSDVICKADALKKQLSERASESDRKTAVLFVKDCEDLPKYVRCFELLYMPKQERHFSSVEEALGILKVAEKLLCQELIDCCMKYIGAVPWTFQQEQAIRSCISALNLKPSLDLAPRLLPPPYVSLESDLVQDLDKTLAELKVAHEGNMISEAYSKLMWLIEDFQRHKVADKAVQFLAGENELAEIVWEHVKVCNLSHECCLFVSEGLNRLFGELQHGKVVVGIQYRASLVTAWFPVFCTLQDRCGDFECGDWLESVIESLPFYDRQRAFVRFLDLGFHNSKLFKRVSSAWCRSSKECCDSKEIFKAS